MPAMTRAPCKPILDAATFSTRPIHRVRAGPVQGFLAVTQFKVGTARDGKIAALYLFFDELP
jgi:hypothetical protein